MQTYIGIKGTMTQVWETTGKRMGATVVKAEPLKVTQLKTAETDGYRAVQVGFGATKKSRNSKALTKHFEKAKIEVPAHVCEIKLTGEETYNLGDQITIDQVFKVGDKVTAMGFSKGRGFAGGVKRYGFKGGPKTHGQSDRQRAPGSIGQGTTPGRILKGKRMAGHYGLERFTIKNLTVLKVDPKAQEILISGSIPGSKGSLVTLAFSGTTNFKGLFTHEVEKPEVTEVEETVKPEQK